MSNVRDLIASKQSDLVRFVGTHAALVVAADVDDAGRGRLAVDMLRLLAAATSAPAPIRPAVMIEPPPASFGQFIDRETATIAWRGEAHRWVAPLPQAAPETPEPEAPVVTTRVSAGRGRERTFAPEAVVIDVASVAEASAPKAVEPAAPTETTRVSAGRKGVAPLHSDNVIAAEIAKGGTLREVGARLGGSATRVADYFRRQGVRHPRPVKKVVPKPVRDPAAGQPRRRFFSDDVIAAAVDLGGTREQVAEPIGCSVAVVASYHKRVGTAHARQSALDEAAAWDSAARARLLELFAQDPRPPISEIASQLGRTTAAVQTAASRFGFTRSQKVESEWSKPVAISARKQRDCMTCRRAFLSEGAHNRMCARCISRGDDAVAA